MTVYYEWDVETVTTVDSEETEANEVLEHWPFDTLKECCKHVRHFVPEPGVKCMLALVRDDDAGRSWAYANADGTLSTWFLDAYQRRAAQVPVRFQREAARYAAELVAAMASPASAPRGMVPA